MYTANQLTVTLNAFFFEFYWPATYSSSSADRRLKHHLLKTFPRRNERAIVYVRYANTTEDESSQFLAASETRVKVIHIEELSEPSDVKLKFRSWKPNDSLDKLLIGITARDVFIKTLIRSFN